MKVHTFVAILLSAVTVATIVLFVFLPVETVETTLTFIGSHTTRILRLVTALVLDTELGTKVIRTCTATIGTRN